MTGKSFTDWFTKRKTQLSHRQLLLISGDAHWCREQVEQLLQHTRSPTLLLSNSALKFDNVENLNFLTTCHISQYKQQLGTEYDIVVYNAFDGLKPSALYAVEGVIGKSGLLVLLCPTLENWAKYESAHPGIAFSFNSQHSASIFIERIQQILLNDKSVAYINQNTTYLPFAFVNEHLQREAQEFSNMQGNSLQNALSSDQLTAFDASLSNAKASKSIGLVTAKRGRGKSTLLGRIAAEIAMNGCGAELYITAPHVNNAQRAQYEYRAVVRHSTLGTLRAIHKNKSQSVKTELGFIAPDQLHQLSTQTILIIDEAAAIAPSILLYACNKFSHVVMATTVAGYEGSGLGFNLRVLPKLKALCHSSHSTFNHSELHKPLRWLDEDALEALFADIFAPFSTDVALLDVQAPPLHSLSNSHNTTTQLASPHYHLVDKNWLILHQCMLAQAVSLLTQSHYQTTPDDLMRILDAADHHIAILANSDDLTHPDVLVSAVAIIVDEGNLDLRSNEALLEGVLCSQRRVNGHLVAQNLTATFADDWFLTAKSWRISRIAVDPEFRRKGLGNYLLNCVNKSAERAEVQYLSTSFGLTSELLSFWRAQHFSLLKIGARRDTSSGEHSGIMFASLTKSADVKFTSYYSVALNDIDYFLHHIVNQYAYLDSVLRRSDFVQKYVNNVPLTTHSVNVTKSTHKLRIDQFIACQRSFAHCAASIYSKLQDLDTDAAVLLKSLFLKAHEKNFSKDQKQLILSELRTALKQK